jgi:hypothetical protein
VSAGSVWSDVRGRVFDPSPSGADVFKLLLDGHAAGAPLPDALAGLGEVLAG